jgi:hypothetical protein
MGDASLADNVIASAAFSAKNPALPRLTTKTERAIPIDESLPNLAFPSTPTV